MQRYRPLDIVGSACLSGAMLYPVGVVPPHDSILRGHGPAPVILSQRERRQLVPTAPMKELCSSLCAGFAQTALVVCEVAKTE